MKRYITLIFVLIVVVMLCACGQIGSEPSSKNSASDVSVTAENVTKPEPQQETPADEPDTAAQGKQEGTVSIEITPPDGWTKNEGSVLPVHYMKGTAGFMVKEERFAGATLDEVVNEALGIYRNSFDNLEVQGEIEPLTIDEKDARKLTFTCTVGKISMKYIYVYLFAADRTFVITFGDSESAFDSLSDDYETILSNIKFKAQ